MACRIRCMNKNDIPQVTAIDREAFPTMWPPVNFNSEMNNRLAHYVVACDGTRPAPEPDPLATKLAPVHTFLGIRWPFSKPAPDLPKAEEYITGFIGTWIMVDELHVINLAVRESERGKGIGEILLISGIEMAEKLKASLVTLEVRASNQVAQNLYTKYGFQQMGIRKGYYTDNKEDAWIMTTDLITAHAYKDHFQKLKEAHFKKLGNFEYMTDGKWV